MEQDTLVLEEERLDRPAPIAENVALPPAVSATFLLVCTAAIALGYAAWSLFCRLRLPAIQSLDILPDVARYDYGFAYGLSIALITLYALILREHRALPRILQLPLIVPVTALISAAVYKLGMYQFGGFDEGLVVNAAGYYSRGSRPFTDFHCSMPPLFMAGIRAAVMLFGLRWGSLMLLTAIFAAVTSLWIFALLRVLAVEAHWAMAMTVCVEVSTMVAIPFWWYNNASYVATALLILSVLACLQQEAAAISWISLAASLTLVLTSKPNGAIACLAVFALLATSEPVRWAKTLAACVAAVALAWLVCVFAQMPLAAIVRSYVEVGKLRGSPFKLLLLLDAGPWLGALIAANLCAFCAVLVGGIRSEPKLWRQYFVVVVAALTCLEMLCTNAELKYSDLSVLLVGTAFLFLRAGQGARASVNRRVLLFGCLTFSTVTAGFFAVLHFRILTIGPGMFYEPFPTKTIQSGFFSGLEASPRLQRVMGETRQVLDAVPANKVFFGPRMEFEYAVFGKTPIEGMPLLWDEGNLFSSDRTPEFLLNFQKQDPDLLIFLKNDYTHMGIMGYYIQRTNTYERFQGLPDITVYVRRKKVPVKCISLADSPPALQ